nr:glycosyl hydrolase family 8 [Blautia sp. AM47-4]
MEKGAVYTGIYPNIFELAGYEKKEIENRIDQIFQTLFYGSDEERIYHPVGCDLGYIEDTGNLDARTEGMSYGMMMCVQMNKKEEFDRIWKWARTYMYMTEGENAGYFAWSCGTDGTRNADGPAPDGEEFFAMALFLPLIAGATGKGFLLIAKRQKSCCIPVFIKEKTEKRDVPCGIRITT